MHKYYARQPETAGLRETATVPRRDCPVALTGAEVAHRAVESARPGYFGPKLIALPEPEVFWVTCGLP
jgi:hypothetical protein